MCIHIWYWNKEFEKLAWGIEMFMVKQPKPCQEKGAHGQVKKWYCQETVWVRTIAIYNYFVILLFVIQALFLLWKACPYSTVGHQLPLVVCTSACVCFYFTVHSIPYVHSFHIFHFVPFCQSGKCYLLNNVFEFYLPSLLNIYPLCYHVITLLISSF